MAKGVEKKYGEERGKKIGEKHGEKIGELKKSKEIAKKLLEKDISIEIIAETTGLTKEEIERLKK